MGRDSSTADWARDTLVLLLAGGQGERLYPLTRDRAKPAVPFGGVYRIIDFTLSNCVNSGLRKVYVLTQYKSISLSRHLRLAWDIFPDEMGEFIEEIPPQLRVVDRWYVGTADAVFQNIYTLERERPKRVLLVSGDHIYKMNYMEMIRSHIERGAALTVGAVEYPAAEARHLGVMVLDADLRIAGFQEKPKENPATIPGSPDRILANMGVYVFDTETLVRRLVEDAKSPGSSHDFGKDLIPRMVSMDPVFAYPFKDENRKEIQYWRDIGTLDAYWEANLDLVQVNPLFNLYDAAWPIRTYQEQAPPAKTVFWEDHAGGRRGSVRDSLVSNGCIVSGSSVSRSVLSPHVFVHSWADVQDSVILEGVDIGRRARIRRAIIDKGVQIPPDEEIGYDLEKDRGRFTVTDSGIVVVPKEMSI